MEDEEENEKESEDEEEEEEEEESEKEEKEEESESEEEAQPAQSSRRKTRGAPRQRIFPAMAHSAVQSAPRLPERPLPPDMTPGAFQGQPRAAGHVGGSHGTDTWAWQARCSQLIFANGGRSGLVWAPGRSCGA